MSRHLISGGLLTVLVVGFAADHAHATGLPRAYRDFKIYVTSQPAATDASKIQVEARMHNEGARPLEILAELPASAQLGFTGSKFQANLQPGGQATWTFVFQPPGDLQRQILKGSIWFETVRARDLWLAIRGPDPDDFSDRSVERITDRAQVVASYAPRTREAIQLLQQRRKKQPVADTVIASQGKSVYRILIEPLPAAVDLEPGISNDTILEAWRNVQPLRAGEEVLIQAVSDLVRCIRIQSDAVLPLARKDDAGHTAIRLRLSEKQPTGKDWPHPDAYRLRVDGNVMIESGTLDGLCQGVYGLLTDHMDCHWFLPSHLGEEIVVPEDRTVALPRSDALRAPSFFSSRGMSWNQALTWDHRNRSVINRGRMSYGHSWHGYINADQYPYDKFPNYYARNRDGSIRKFDRVSTHTNFCTTNPEVLDIVAQKANQALSDSNAIVTSLDPNDVAPMCLCDRCLALDKSYGVTSENGRKATDRLLHFSKQIYDRLDEKNKNKYLGILIYGYQKELPVSAKPHPYHTGLICNEPWSFDHTRPFNDPTSTRNKRFHHLLKGWGALLTQLGFYDYYGHWAYWGPWGVIHKLREDLPAFRDLGGTYVMIESQPNFAIHGLNLYIASQLIWNVEADVDLLLEELFTKFYGPAAGPMRNYWLTIERHQALTRPGANVQDRMAINEPMWSQLDAYLTEAEALVTGAEQRFTDRITFHRDGFQWGRNRLLIQDLYYPQPDRPSSLDLSSSIQLLEENQVWFDQTYDKYASAADYWPPLTAVYFRPNVREQVAKLKKQQAEQSPDRSQE